LLIVPDNTVFVNFAMAGRVDLLEKLFSGNAQWTQTVESECAASSKRPGLSDLARVSGFMGDSLYPENEKERVDMLTIQTGFAGVGDGPTKHLGEAEALSIILNRQLEVQFVTDDKTAYGYAVRNGISCMTTWDILKLCARIGWIDQATAWSHVIVLRGNLTKYHELRSADAFRQWCGDAATLSYL
jgi:Predicted nucleic acid-binding protein, contains PIN domain